MYDKYASFLDLTRRAELRAAELRSDLATEIGEAMIAFRGPQRYGFELDIRVGSGDAAMNMWWQLSYDDRNWDFECEMVCYVLRYYREKTKETHRDT